MHKEHRQVQDNYENRQASTQDALKEISKLVDEEVDRKKVQAEKGFDGLTYFIFRTLLDKKFEKAEEITKSIKNAFVDHPYWKSSDKELRSLREAVYYAVFREEDEVDKVADFVDEFFNLLMKAYDI